MRHIVQRRAFRRQQPRYRSILEFLSVSSQFVLPSSPPVRRFYRGDNYSDAGGSPRGLKMWFAKKYLLSVQLLQKTLEINTQSMDQLRAILFKDIQTIRISDTFEKPEMATDLMEHDLVKLNILRQRGSESFSTPEMDIKGFLK